MTVIYTATFGEVEKHKLVNRTAKGFRVLSGKFDREGVVFQLKQYSGWSSGEDKMFYQQRSFTSKKKAEAFAKQQLLSKKGYYERRLSEIKDLELELSC